MEQITENIEPFSPEKIKAIENKLRIIKEKQRFRLDLQPTALENLRMGIKRNGIKCAVRDNRDAFFFPNQWLAFFNILKKNQKMTFDFLINTGARINEARHVKVGDIDFGRGNIMLKVTKVKAKKGEKNPRPRTISVSSQFLKRLKQHIKEKELSNENYLGLLSKPACHIAIKKALQKAGIKNWHMFSTHNIRKTHGNWLKAMRVDSAEICLRLGHDHNTFVKSYGSSDIFNYSDREQMRDILGDLYARVLY